MAFDNRNKRDFMLGILFPIADSTISRLDAEQILGIYPFLVCYREGSGTSVVSSTASASITLGTTEEASGTSAVSSTAILYLINYENGSGTSAVSSTAVAILTLGTTEEASGTSAVSSTAVAVLTLGTTEEASGVSAVSSTASANLYLEYRENGDQVEYAIYAEVEGVNTGYVKADGTLDSTPDPGTPPDEARWQKASVWGSLITVSGLTQIQYRFKVKARNEVGTVTDYGPWSAIMTPLIELDVGPASNTLTYECTTGNTKVSGLSISGTLNIVEIAYTLTNKDSTTGRVTIEFNNDGGATYSACTRGTKYFGDATSRFDVTNPLGTTFRYTYDGTGTAPQFVTNKMENGSNITISASTNFAAGNQGTFALTAVAETYFEITNASGVIESNKTLAVSTGLAAYSEGITGLATSNSGTAHTFRWATYTDLGNSFHGTAYIRVIPYDASPSGGSVGTEATTTASIDNRPSSVTISEDYVWDSDITPEVVATMMDIVGGTHLYFVLEIRDSTGIVQNLSSAEVTTGWTYEQTYGDGFVTEPTIYGVPVAYVGGGRRIKYTVQTALTPGTDYTFTMYQAEVENVL